MRIDAQAGCVGDQHLAVDGHRATTGRQGAGTSTSHIDIAANQGAHAIERDAGAGAKRQIATTRADVVVEDDDAASIAHPVVVVGIQHHIELTATCMRDSLVDHDRIGGLQRECHIRAGGFGDGCGNRDVANARRT